MKNTLWDDNWWYESCGTCGGPLDDTGHCPECEQNELQAWWAQQDQDEQWIEEQTDGYDEVCR